MQQELFIQKLKEANPYVDMAYVDEVLKKSLSPAGEKLEGFMNLVVVNEEFAECQQQISKFMRNKGDHNSLLEETADALIGIRYIQTICGITDDELKRAVNVKISRQAERVGV